MIPFFANKQLLNFDFFYFWGSNLGQNARGQLNIHLLLLFSVAVIFPKMLIFFSFVISFSFFFIGKKYLLLKVNVIRFSPVLH